MMAQSKSETTGGTLAEKAYRMLKHEILHGKFAEGSFLREADILGRYTIGRTPFREACNRLHNEQAVDLSEMDVQLGSGKLDAAEGFLRETRG